MALKSKRIRTPNANAPKCHAARMQLQPQLHPNAIPMRVQMQLQAHLHLDAIPCNCNRTSHEVFVTVHGDDFTVTGPETELRWMQAKMAAKHEVKTKFLGPSSPHKQEIRVLNRTLRWTAEGVEYEADQRHGELIVKGMEMENAAPAPIPGVTYTKEEAKDSEDSALMSNPDASAFRGLAARLNYLSVDRAYLQHAGKEVAQKIAAPREADWAKLK